MIDKKIIIFRSRFWTCICLFLMILFLPKFMKNVTILILIFFVNFAFLDGGVPRSTSYGVYISLPI